ncbi:PREDICTED: pentatricopeptide repeat-containing protein At2g17210 [Nelumbo nucifera]|uniref:Pentatricopeptide repeat-containing protein At2g17210 n=2 Tax=Nelumbo nucifera TaxID=4432 RepID=A0A822ZJC0_NELNU|nr:PREDICTED: pentatricopeptide repeat-containing protein At2g17210 [Nelumbo nucifera]DAD41817.1 TPA_asm: hypothetical protein HUJ06_016140 [Nelumbo nucifera]DAD41818.1 TPA_asm: hypothetical protein HUJ06_016141 [Nelumbo nucifera]
MRPFVPEAPISELETSTILNLTPHVIQTPGMRPLAILSNSRFPNWNMMIKQSSFHGQWQEVLSQYYEMRTAGFQLLDHSVLPAILKACAKLQSLKQGKSVHAYMIKQGLKSSTSIANSTMDFYVKCGAMDSALGIFYCARNRDSVSWNIIIHGYLEQGAFEEGLCLFRQARVAAFVPIISTILLILQACRSLSIQAGLTIHAFIIRSAFSTVASVQNSLLNMYVDFANMDYAQQLFDEMPEKDVISWSVIIGGYAKCGGTGVAIRLFRDMISGFEVKPDGLIMVNFLKACANAGDIVLGRVAHGHVINRGLNIDSFVANSLVDMYSKCEDIDSAFKVFHEIPNRNIVSWNSMLSGFVHNMQHLEALVLFDSMGEAGIEADEVTLVNLLQVCKNLTCTVKCKSIHSTIIRRGYEVNELVLNSLIDAYAKCGMVELAWKLFGRMKRRDMVSWSTMIAGFAHCGMPDEAIATFQEMNRAQERPNAVTLLSLLEACSVAAELRRSKWAHGFAIRRELATEVAVGTAILDMYAKCGAMDASRRVFDRMPKRNILTWSAMIAAYGMNGRAHDALALLAEMEVHGLKPNAITILSALTACSHGGLVEEGLSCFRRMVADHGLEPGLEHYSCIVDMLGRAGKLDCAADLIKRMPEGGVKAGASAWGALLSACRNHGNSELGEGAASRVLELEPSNSAGYLLASSMYAAGGIWDEVARMRCLMKERGLKVVAGYSLVHVEDRTCRFVARDVSHPQAEEIHATVLQLHKCMKMDERKH